MSEREIKPEDIIHEPLLTKMLEAMDRQGIDPMLFIEFIGDVAVHKCEQ